MKIEEKDINFLKNLKIFHQIEQSELFNLLKIFNAHKKQYAKNTIINSLWDPITEAGIILNGSVFVEFLSVSGNEHHINLMKPGNIFGLSFACTDSSGEAMEIRSAENTEIIFLEFSNLFSGNYEQSKATEQVSKNLLRALANKNVFLNKKVEILSHHKIRDRVFIYLQTLSKGHKEFEVPFNREEMASFLGVERSALSRELSKMKSANLIDYDGNTFLLKDILS